MVKSSDGENDFLLHLTCPLFFHFLTCSPAHIIKGEGGGIRTYSALKQQSYSLSRLSSSGAPPLSNLVILLKN